MRGFRHNRNGILAAFIVAFFCGCAFASISAGTSITNEAFASYRDASTGIIAQLNSNVVSADIEAVEALDLSPDHTISGAPGSSFTAQHVLTNTGTVPTVYSVSLSIAPESTAALQTLIGYWDVNKNGKPEPGEPVISGSLSITLQPGESTSLIVYAVVVADAASGSFVRVKLTVTTQGKSAQASNLDTVQIQAGSAALSLTKASDTRASTPNAEVGFTLTATNNGSALAAGAPVVVDGAAQTLVLIRDEIPANTLFSSVTLASGVPPLFHLSGDPLHQYSSAQPEDKSRIDVVAFGFPKLEVGQRVNVGFKVTISSNASGSVTNVGEIYARDGSRDLHTSSNQVLITLPSVPPSISFFSASDYSHPTSVSLVGASLYVQANAPQCNLQPDTVEKHLISLSSSLTSDKETYLAVETGPNTGIFRIDPNVPTRDGSANAVTVGNGTMEIVRNDVLTALLQGCGSASVQANVLVDPSGVVFDSRTNEPIGNANVSLIDVTGLGNGGHPGQGASVLAADGVTAAPNTVVTSSDGRFSFPLVAPSTYKLVVEAPVGFSFPSKLPTTQLPIGRFVDAQASYNLDFRIEGNTAVRFDVPLDRSTKGTTMLEKTASVSTAEIGDFVDYTISVKNVSSVPVTNLIVTDTLPNGFSYQKGTTRIGGGKATDPKGDHGPTLQFAIDTLASNSQTTIVYRVHIGQGVHLGKNKNVAVAADGFSTSNTASAVVDVQGGAFRAEAFIIGKVYMDCNGNRRQDAGELGVPGVRVVLEDQTFAITDGEGKYSIYGIPAHTHIVKIDRSSFPNGFHPIPLSNRNSGDGGTLFADLKSGEMFKADFASACSDLLKDEVTKLRALPEYKGNHNDDAALGMTFNYEATHRGLTEAKSANASGIVGSSTNLSNGTPNVGGDKTAASDKKSMAVESSAQEMKSAHPAALEDIIKGLDNRVDFINLTNGQTMAFTQTVVRVKGPRESVFKLVVNGEVIGENRIAKKVSNTEGAVDGWEYIGVELKPGANLLQLIQFDQFGNERGKASVQVLAPKQLHKLKIELPKDPVADGKTQSHITVRMLDEDNVPVRVPTEITLESSDGEWDVKDVNPKEPGIQAFVRDGVSDFVLKAPSAPVSAKLRVSSGNIQTETVLEFVPELRPVIAAGVVDQVINFRKFSGGSGTSASLEGFEQALNRLSLSSAGGGTQYQSHVGLSLKGALRDSYLVTLAYDSDKDSNERLFRDIQPDDYYPVYGDSSVRGYDAQSTSRAYLRVDKGKNYLLYGDFTTQDAGQERFLSVYTRSATGIRQHFQSRLASVTTFASHDSRTQIVEEIPANGTSGPYALKDARGVVNSEIVELLVRDRNQPAIVISKQTLARFSDYEFDNDLGQILFKLPVQSLDEHLNPISIRVSYEVDAGGPKFWLGGLETNFKLGNRVQFGGMYVADTNPTDEYRLLGLNSVVKLDNRTQLVSEFAKSDKDSIGDGTAYRVELKRESAALNVRTYLGRSTSTFDNPNALLNKGRGEAGMKVNWRLGKSDRLVVDALRTEGTATGGTQVGAQISVEHALPRNSIVEFGVKHVETGRMPTGSSTDAAAGTTITSFRTRFTTTVPSFSKLRVYTEVEQDAQSTDKRNISVGGTYQLFERGKLYVRHELISSLGNTYSLNSQQQEAVTVFGIDTNYMKNAHVFSEYRGNDSFAGRDTEAAIGLRNVWTLAPGLKVNTGMESIKVLKGSGPTDSLALTASGEYTASPLWKGTGRFEWRTSSTSTSFLNTLGASVRMDSNWTLLGRHVLNIVHSTTTSKNDSQQERVQVGFAYRDTATSVFNALAMVELKAKHAESATASTDSKIAVISANFNYQPASPIVFTGRYASRLTIDNSDTLASRSVDNLLSGRVTCDINPKWDLGLNSMIGFSRGFGSKQYGFGPEVGRQVAKNLWLSVGYNVFGFSDTDLSSEHETNRGGFIRFRYKFDERLFKRGSDKN